MTIGQLLDFVETVIAVVFGDLAVFLERLELVVGFAADVAHSNALFFGGAAGDFGQLGAAFLTQFRNRNADEAAIAKRGDTDVGGVALGIGFTAAFISGLLACKWMIDIVKKGKLVYFAAYCLVIGFTAILI